MLLSRKDARRLAIRAQMLRRDRPDGLLVVNAIHQDVEFTPAMTQAINGEIADLASWLNLEVLASH